MYRSNKNLSSRTVSLLFTRHEAQGGTIALLQRMATPFGKDGERGRSHAGS